MAPTPLGRKAIRLGAAMLTLGAIAAPGFAKSAWAKGSSPAKLDQCADGPRSAPVLCVTAKSWVNGNLGPSKSHYFEGDSIPYRLELGGLNPGADVHTAVIQWDNTQKGKHAIDYITTYDRTVTADPCAGVATCGPPTMEPIPADPEAINQVAGAFTIFGGSITGVSAYTESGSSSNGSSSITISFTASVDDPVLAWGGHIASQADWGKGNSAISISGSPYHMRLLSFDGTGGNQDRSLGNAAVAPVVTPPTPTPTPDPVVTPTPPGPAT